MDTKHAIKCPHCGEQISLQDLNPLAEIVRDDEFRKVLSEAMNSERKAFESEKARMTAALAEKDDQIAYLKDMRLKLSTKMIGESLEQHCESEFDRIRAMAFPNAEFAKDNDISGGSKGDYIFREFDDSGVEIVSIMFEMKNEMQDTRVRHKNKDFFEKLDADRISKNCEYAVLVSTLEPESEYYNAGIVDVGYAYPKMLVVRPQCFLTVIGLLRNTGLQALEYKRQITELENAQSDLNLIEGRIDDFKTGFGKNCDSGRKKLRESIDELDKLITRLEKTRDALESADRQFGIAARKSENLTAKKILDGITSK